MKVEELLIQSQIDLNKSIIAINNATVDKIKAETKSILKNISNKTTN